MKISKINYTTRQMLSMSRKELAKVVSILASAANKRLKRIETAGLENYSSAYRYIERTGGKFSVAGKNTEELIVEYKRAKGFLSPSRTTSTIKGIKASMQENETKVQERLGVTFKNEEESKDFWKAYNKYADNHRAKVYNTGSDTIQKLIAQRVERGQSLNASAVTRMINKYIKSQREELERIEREEFNAISDRNFETENPFLK